MCFRIQTLCTGARDIPGSRCVGETHPSLLTLVPGAAEAKGSSKLLSTFLWLCGMERRQESAESVPKPEPLPVASLEEKPLVKHVLNINLLLCVCAGVFLWAYFA